jgi:hypothetical protein
MAGAVTPRATISGRKSNAIERLAEAERKGARVKLLANNQGVVRLHTKTVEEMAHDKVEAKANSSAADKGKMTKVG